MQRQARITSKGRITLPLEIRRLLGVRPGDRVVFETGGAGMRFSMALDGIVGKRVMFKELTGKAGQPEAQQ